MNNVWTWIVVAVIVIGGGFWWWQSSQTPKLSDDGTPAVVDKVDDANAPQAPAANQGTSVNAGATVSVATAPMSASVTYNGAGFSPSSVTIAKGDTVTFTSTSDTMWVASAPHPTHEGYDGTTRAQHCAAGYSGPKPFDQCASGTSFSFTFNKAGTWRYHDHTNSNLGGTVIVQ